MTGGGDRRDWMGEVFACIGFFTRLSVPAYRLADDGFARALWAAPIAGLVPAFIGALVLALPYGLGVPALGSAAFALGAMLLVTGALHEDGLADVADGFGGGATRERKLAIMKDSFIGSYGVAALVISLLARGALLAALAPFGFWTALGAQIAAHCASRALLPWMLQDLPNARGSGVSAGVGAVPRDSATLALGIGAIALLPLGIGAAIAAAVLLLLTYFIVRTLAQKQIGGQTGDVLGALQQAAEITVLVVAASTLH